jgi:hypothetical protein
MTGRWRDAVVGRDLLFGLCAGVVAHLLWGTHNLLQLRGGGDYITTTNSTEAIAGLRHTLALLPNETTEALIQAFAFFLLFFLCRIVGRRDSIAVVLISVVLSLPHLATPASPLPSFALNVLVYCILFGVTLRVGLTGIFAALWIADLLFAAPVTMNFDLWFAPYAGLIFAVFCTAGFLAFRLALARRPLLPQSDA